MCLSRLLGRFATCMRKLVASSRDGHSYNLCRASGLATAFLLRWNLWCCIELGQDVWWASDETGEQKTWSPCTPYLNENRLFKSTCHKIRPLIKYSRHTSPAFNINGEVFKGRVVLLLTSWLQENIKVMWWSCDRLNLLYNVPHPLACGTLRSKDAEEPVPQLDACLGPWWVAASTD